jgi:excinuclease ABC subunit A
VVLVDQSPVGTTPRSNPATYMKAFDGIRRLFASADLSRLRGYTPSTFSFNVEGGRCELAAARVLKKSRCSFSPTFIPPARNATASRYREEVLEVAYRGKNIRQVLDLTITEALEFFKDTADVKNALYPLRAVGLEYVRLGQPLTTLSGGESQRLKLAAHMARAKKAERCLFSMSRLLASSSTTSNACSGPLTN